MRHAHGLTRTLILTLTPNLTLALTSTLALTPTPNLTRYDMRTGKAFLVASQLIDVCKQFGELPADLAEKVSSMATSPNPNPKPNPNPNANPHPHRSPLTFHPNPNPTPNPNPNAGQVRQVALRRDREGDQGGADAGAAERCRAGAGDGSRRAAAA